MRKDITIEKLMLGGEIVNKSALASVNVNIKCHKNFIIKMS